MWRFKGSVVTAVIAGMLVVPTAALAEGDLGAGTKNGKVPRIISSTPMKPVSFAEAKRRQAAAKRKGKRPRGPILASTKGLTKAPKLSPDARNRTPSAEAQEVPITNEKPTGADGKLFGFEGTYDAKKWPILNWVNYVYYAVIPRLGGNFRQPAVAEVPSGGVTPTGCGPITFNAMYCGGVNSVGWSTDFGHFFFDNYGDTAFATYMAHEYGHGAQQWFGLRGGWMQYTLYSEGFADCMAGGWLYWMYAHGYTDTIGRGDLTEIVDGLARGADASTTLGGHGDAQWRVGMASYGWTYGMQGCRDWGRYVASR